MSTPTPGKHPLSQGKTPSQPQPGAAATPSVSTPFSAAAAFSPHGPRSSPQQFKKSPTATLGRSTGPVNYDSPSAAAALGILDISSLGLDLQNLGNLGKASEDERARRLDSVIAVLGRSKGLVSEAGLERLAKKLELEFIWENSMDSDDSKTLIVAGSALELLIGFRSDIVQSVNLAFPDSAEIVNKHAEAAGKILFKDLQLLEGQSPLTKSLENFAANFERLAILDKLSISPGLNMYEAVAGIYESLCRLHTWELQQVRGDPAAAAKGEDHLESLVLCTRSGNPTMNTRGRVGMALDYWKDRRLQPPPTEPEMIEWVEENEQVWSILIDCAPLREIGVNPVRISDKWIGPDVEKVPLPDELHTGGPIIDWLEPESTFVPTPDQTKADPMQPDASILGPRLPDAVFHATFDPPVHIPTTLWGQIQQLGCMMDETPLKQLATFDSLVLPYPPGKEPEAAAGSRTVTCNRQTAYAAPGEEKLTLKSHANTLYVSKPIPSRTLTTMTFSHPQQLITILPYLRQYAFLATLLERSLTQDPDPTRFLDPADVKPAAPPTITGTTTTSQDDYDTLANPLLTPKTDDGPEDNEKDEEEGSEGHLNIDLTLTMLPVPQLRVVFPFRDRTAHVTLEIQENGHVHVDSQDVLDDSNMVAPNGRQRSGEDVGALLERMEDVGKWAEFIRSRWA
ncbi:hypothetical protein CHGG_07023 [Chaetomium globosum CBS 148.51]|uniref:Mediator of RNA polymerase II transcription subunit 1 n=1 Tax=Chaetomium globosum (strain ATCC 6205 / CBS 148.51 / DSM 1962 / NBRC 6347 / NRRL 1970) TaxID=306901 RepID=Q2GYD1_CHAGB|nr:uncharacterized protein CHGG_07023 [Chaetomium globosum CBS 148.51]EAQ85770.1 hypothetical protein CHGG_07023 [Chaetomium globosum CBS 148.51]